MPIAVAKHAAEEPVLSRFSINFRDTSPTYEIEIRPTTRDDFAKEGISEELTKLMFPGRAQTAMIPPELWFWYDRQWFKRTPAYVLDEMGEISGGTFNELFFSDQIGLFELTCNIFPGARVNGVRGKWLSRNNTAISIEQLGVEYLESNFGGRGFFESPGIWGAAAAEFPSMFGRNVGQDRARNWIVIYPADHIADLMRAVEAAIADPARIISAHAKYLASLSIGKFDLLVYIRQVENYIEWVGPEHIRKYMLHSLQLTGRVRWLQIRYYLCALQGSGSVYRGKISR